MKKINSGLNQKIVIPIISIILGSTILILLFINYSFKNIFSTWELFITALLLFVLLSTSVIFTITILKKKIDSKGRSKAIDKESILKPIDHMLAESQYVPPEIKDNPLYSGITDHIKHHQIQNSELQKQMAHYENLVAGLSDDIAYIKTSSKLLKEVSQKFYRSAYSQSSEIEDITNAMNQFATQITEIANHTTRADQFAIDTKSVTETGVAKMNEMMAAISAISESSNSVLKVINTIDDIADKTKLLALNATIEANRAEEHGRAFGVVAEEVRDLAIHSREAAQETTRLVEATIENVKSGDVISLKTVEALNKIKQEVNKATEMIKEISQSSNHQAQSTVKFKEGLTEITRLAEAQKVNAKETTSIAEKLTGYATQMEKNLNKVSTPDALKSRQKNEALNEIKQIGRPFKFVLDHFPPMHSNVNGEFKGIFIDIIEEIIRKRMGIEIEYSEFDWDTCQTRVIAGEYDGLITTPTPERLVHLKTHINTGYAFDWVIWTYSGHEKYEKICQIDSVQDIEAGGYTVGTYSGNAWVDNTFKSSGVDIRYFENEFTALAQQKADIVIEEPLLTHQKIKAGGIDIHQIVETRVVFQTVPFQLMIGKKSPFVEMLPEFNRKVREIRLDGTMEQIMSQYT